MSRLKYAIDSPHTRPWTERIGKIIVNFSALELESIRWLVQLSEQHQSIGTFVATPFAARITQVTGHIEARSTSSRWRKESLRAWNDALKLAKIRNRIAHNPVMFAWNNPAETGEPDFVGIPSMRKAGFAAKETLLSKATADRSTNEMVALIHKLEALRVEWCDLRDKGQAPAAQVVLIITRWDYMKARFKALLSATLSVFGKRN
jgi:hypothetical protein